MPRAVLFRCPVCGVVRALEGDGVSKTEAFGVVEGHLTTHPLSEPQQAIRKHQAAAERIELLLSKTDLEQLPTGAWDEPNTEQLPERLTAELEMSAKQSPVEAATDVHASE